MPAEIDNPNIEHRVRADRQDPRLPGMYLRAQRAVDSLAFISTSNFSMDHVAAFTSVEGKSGGYIARAARERYVWYGSAKDATVSYGSRRVENTNFFTRSFQGYLGNSTVLELTAREEFRHPFGIKEMASIEDLE